MDSEIRAPDVRRVTQVAFHFWDLKPTTTGVRSLRRKVQVGARVSPQSPKDNGCGYDQLRLQRSLTR